MYDQVGRPIDTYGPAAAAMFTGLTPSAGNTNQVPRTATAYDEGITGLHVSYWNDPVGGASHFNGAPVVTGIANPAQRSITTGRPVHRELGSTATSSPPDAPVT